MACTSFALRPGSAAQISAATPAAKGEAKLVPLAQRTLFTPGLGTSCFT